MIPGLSYELNPPRIFQKELSGITQLKDNLDLMLGRARQVSEFAECIQLTDSVLGEPRLSSINTAYHLVHSLERSKKIRCNMRVSDHSLNGIIQMAGDAVLAKLEGILLLRGDVPRYGDPVTQKPSKVLSTLRDLGIAKAGLRLYLGTSCKPTERDLERKLRSEPDGLITQPVEDLESTSKLHDNLHSRGFSLIATVLVPSAKNVRSAALMNFDWSYYSENPSDFIHSLRSSCSEVLVTSPNSFDEGLSLLHNIQNDSQVI
uniref:Methylenetetrahydrofolate reductase (NAD(P)H) n=1 Tax=uncultured marine thaumarchaeote KM3_74_C10 TaxID=1456270 RepID=A0A075HRB9_9ARCH|nr:hypothetical protein [uncultured marine thaumarchaeote KM3_74_C10]